MTDDNTTGKTAGRKRRRRWTLISVAGVLALVIAGTTWGAMAHSDRHKGGHGFGWFAEKKIERMLDKVEASDDQRARVHAIVKAAVADLQEVRGLKREVRQDLVAALTKESIDRAELEALRQRKLETVDRMSQRMLTALADAAEVLTPAQRAELAEKWKSHGRHHHRHD